MQTLPRSGFDEYVTARSPMLLRFAYLLCGDRHLAEDLVQEVLIKAHRRWSSIEAENPDAYLKRALLHTHLSWRRRRSSAEVAGATIRDVATMAAFDDEHASREDMWALLATLSPRQRAVLVLRYFEDLDDRRIAELVGSTAAAVRVHAHRGLTTLRETLAQQAAQAPDDAGLAETVRRAAARAAARRRLATVSGIAAVAAVLALLIPLIVRDGAPVQPAPSVTPTPTATSTLTLVPVPLSEPVFPYRLTFVPAGLGPSYVTVSQFGFSLTFGEVSPLNSSYRDLSISVDEQPNLGNAPVDAVRTTWTIKGQTATQWVAANGAGGEFVDLQWQYDGRWFFATTAGEVTAAEVRAMAEGLAPGTTAGTRPRLITKLTRMAVPPGSDEMTWELERVCAAPTLGDAGWCVEMSPTDFALSRDEELTIDGSPAYRSGLELVVRRPDGTYVRVTTPLDASYTVVDLVAVYRGLTFAT
jgi:RNA polymerase sigma-70 factor (sigma-E family)